MSKLLVMTDPHLTAAGKPLRGIDPLRRFSAALAHAKVRHADADHLFLTGDLANDGERQAYECLKTALEDCPWPVTFLMGNHDDRTAFRQVFPETPVDEHGFIQAKVEFPDVCCIALDTLDQDTSVLHSGHLCDRRLHWLERTLNATQKPTLLFMHHPPFDTGLVAMDGIRLLNEGALQEILGGKGVVHLFAGHLHRTIHSSFAGIPASIFKSTWMQMPLRLGKDGFGDPTAEPGGYGIVVTDSQNTVVHSDDF